MRTAMRLTTFAVCLTGAMACGGGASGGGPEAPVGDTTSGGEASYAGPIASTDTVLGKARFGMFCADCHGDDASGDVGPALKDIGWTPAKLRQQVREGSGRMKPVAAGRLSDQDLEAVLAWLGTIGAVKAE